MLRAVIELSKYILVINILLYTLTSFMVLRRDDRERRGFVFVLQYLMILINHMTGSLVLLSSRKDFTYLFLPLFQVIVVFAFLVLMRAIYPRADRLIQNHIALLLSISFVILTRISLTRSIRQFTIVAISLVAALIIPAFMKYTRLLKSFEYIFAAAGILILGVVLIRGSITNGSKLSFSIMGLSFQPSEFVKIIYVLFLAAILSKAERFVYVVLSAVLAAVHVPTSKPPGIRSPNPCLASGQAGGLAWGLTRAHQVQSLMWNRISSFLPSVRRWGFCLASV